MAGLSGAVEAGLFAWLRGAAMPAPPGGLWLALWNGDSGDAGTGGAEVTATVRPAGRVAVTFGAPSAGVMANAGAVDFGAAAGATSVSHFALFDAVSGGTLLLSGAVSGGTQAVAAGTTVAVAAGALTVALG